MFKSSKYSKSVLTLIEKNDKFGLSGIVNKQCSSTITDYFKDVCFNNLNDYQDLNTYIIVYCMLYDDCERLKSILRCLGDNLRFSHKFFYYIVRENKTHLLEFFIEYTKNVTNQLLFDQRIGEYFDSKNETTLLRAIKNQNEQSVELIVNELGASVYTQNIQKQSPLFVAAGLNNEKIVKFLLSKGAYVDSVNINRDTPLIQACLGRKFDNVKVLIDNGANINHCGNFGNTPLMTTVTDDVYHDNDEHQSQQIFMYLINKKAKLNLKNSKGATAFVRACGSIDFNMVKILHENLLATYGINSSYVQRELNDGLINAFYYLRLETIEYLIQFIESKNIINSKLDELFSFKTNLYLSQISKIFDYDKKITILDTLMGCLLKYDYHHKSKLFYVNKYFQVMCNHETRHLFETDLYDDYKVKFLSTLENLIVKMIHYGKLNISEVDTSIICENLYYIENENFLDLLENIKMVINRLKTNNKNVLSLKVLSRNQVRGSIKSLSNSNIGKLDIPNQLKSFLLA